MLYLILSLFALWAVCRYAVWRQDRLTARYLRDIQARNSRANTRTLTSQERH